jgi:predicted alpha/beta hydrolase family esterase
MQMRQERQILFVQGAGEGVHDGWDSKLVASLRHELGNEFNIQYPRMPNEDDPSYELWKSALEGEFSKLPDGAILVGHSVGGAILVRMLAAQAAVPRLYAIISIASPFLGNGGWSVDDVQFPPDLGARLPQGAQIHFFHGLDDKIVPASHAELYERAVPQARVHRLPGRDHQLNNNLSEVATVVLSL